MEPRSRLVNRADADANHRTEQGAARDGTPAAHAHAPNHRRRTATASDEWMQRVGGYARLPALIRHLGVEPAPLFSQASLDIRAFDREQARIPYAALARLLRVSAQRTGCAHVGMLAGRMCGLSDLGAFGAVVRNSPTVGDALRALVEYQHLDSDSAVAYVANHGATAELGYAIYHPHVFAADELTDSIVAAACNYLRELCGGEWVPSAVTMARVKPHDVAPYRSFFKVAPRFNAEVCALRFPAHWLRRPIADARSDRLRSARGELERAAGPDLLQHVYRTVRLLLLESRGGGDDLAWALEMHRRTLNRRLKVRGTTFRHVLDNVRFAVARELLSMSAVSLDDVAAAAGYSGVNAFMRSFRRWAGTTPGQWRRARAMSSAAPAIGVPAIRRERARDVACVTAREPCDTAAPMR